MLSYALAIAVALSSLVLFLTAFLMSDIHRKDDFLWSAVGLFYALVLWFCARNMTGAVLLGQTSASVLSIAFIWQTLKLRKAVAHPERAIAISNFSVLQAVNNLLKGKKKKPQAATTPPTKESPDVVTESDISIPEAASDETESSTVDSKIAAQKKASKTKPLGKIFGKKNQAKVTKIESDEILDKSKAVEPTSADEREDIQPQTPIKSDRTQVAEEPIEQKPEPEIKDSKPKDIADTLDKVTQEEAEVVVAPPKTEELATPKLEEETKATDLDEEIIEDETTDKIDVEITVEVKSESQANTSEPETASLSEEISQEQDVARPAEPVEAKTDLGSKVVPVDTEKPERAIKPKAKESSLDALETVEVAEILEALPENSSGERNDRSNIIEVTTTEIEEITEVKQLDEDSSDTKSD